MNKSFGSCTLLFALTTSLSASSAWAARDTEVAPFLHAEINAGYGGWNEWGILYEYGLPVGRINQGEVGSRFDLKLGILPSAEFFVTLPMVSTGHRSYESASLMQPCSYGEGQMQSGPYCTVGSTIHMVMGTETEASYPIQNDQIASPPSYNWKGLNDMVFGLRITPFHEANLGSLDTKRKPALRPMPALATWRLEFGVIAPTGGTFYEQQPGAGALGFVLGTSFSKRTGMSDTYFSLKHQLYGTYDMMLVDSTGASVKETMEPPNETDLLFGVELITYEDNKGSRFSVDFAAGAHLWSDSTVVSGKLLPSVIVPTQDAEGTYGSKVIEEAHYGYQTRLRLSYKALNYVRIEASTRLMYKVPHRLESPYRVIQGKTVAAGYGLEVSAFF